MGGVTKLGIAGEKLTRWDGLKEVFFYKEQRKAIGSAWPLYFYLVFKGDPNNHHVTSTIKLSEDLGEKGETIKKWREKLIQAKVIESKRTKHGVILKVLPPFDTPISATKDDFVELRLKSDSRTRNLLKMALGADSMTLLPIIAELQKKLETLESKVAA